MIYNYIVLELYHVYVDVSNDSATFTTLVSLFASK